jgi:transposase
VGQVIQEEFGVTYSDSHVGRLLAKIGWTRQKPTTQAAQRDEAEIQEWHTETLPELKKKPRTKGEPSCL